MKSARGFSLIEVLLSIAMIAILAGLSVPIYNTFQVQNELHIAADTFTQTARRAQSLARSGTHDSDWGVSVQAGQIVLFSGDSYTARDVDRDESFELPTTVTPSGASEVVFDRTDGVPPTTPSITFTGSTGDSEIVAINAWGVAD